MSRVRITCGGNNKCLQICGCKLSYKVILGPTNPGPTSLLYNGNRFFRGGKERPRRDADPSPLLVP